MRRLRVPAEIADGSRDDLAGRRLARTIRCAISVDTLAGASRRTRLQAAMLDGAEDGLMLLSAVRGGDGTVHDFMCRAANPAAGRLLAGPLAGSSLRRQIPGLAWLFDELVHLLAYDCPIALDHPVAGAERPAWLRISANPADRDHVALAISDVTHHHLLAQALRGLREERQTNEQNRLALLTDASHGLRTPLNSIIGFAEIINAEMLGRLNVPRYREYVRDILVAGRHLLEVVDSFADRERLQLTAARDDEGHRALIELAPDMVCMIRGGRVTMMNTAGAEMLGCPGSGMIGQAFAGVIHSDYVGIAEDDFAVLAAERTRVPMKFVRHDGRLIEVEVAASRLRDGDGPSVMLLARDVTERNRATRSVVAREERLRKIMDTVADGLVIVDEHGIIDSVNPAAERIFDHDARTLVGQAVDEVLAEPFAVLRARLAGRRAGAAADYETMARRRDGGLVPVEISVSELTLADRRLFIGVMRDVTRRRQIEAHLRYLAHHEPLTGLPNRALLQERLQAAVQRADLADRPVAVLFIDLDNFKYINDTMGHPFGDRLLQAVARRLEGCIGGEDTIGHPAGDEFIVVLPSISGAAAAESTAQEILRALAQPFALDDKDIYITASIGVALYPGDGRDLPSLMKNVDMATFHAKSMGRNNVQFFTQELSTPGPGPGGHREWIALRPGPARTGTLLPAEGRPDDRPGGGRRSAVALARTRTGAGLAHRLHPGGRGNRPDHPHRPLGAANRLPPGPGLAPPGPARAGHRRQPVGPPVQAPGTGPGNHRRAEGYRHQPGAGGIGTDREHAGRQRPGSGRDHAGAEDPGGAAGHRRFRHRLFLARLPEALPARRAEDRPQFRQGHPRRRR